MSRPCLTPDSAAPLPPPRISSSDPAYELARSIWATAAALGVRAMEALAAMAVNRARLLGVSPGHVARDGELFACQLPFHPLNTAMQDADSRNPTFAMALRIARRAMTPPPGQPDPSRGATCFHASGDLPAWEARAKPVAEVAGIIFYVIKPEHQQ
ncbi:MULTISPECIES: cell wall hydrolase [unclassified Azospirillum]|uniref:cell wall hydrolase n=1 Tax=unclassified Azospirillum TaxID=2630922 RepID=UPI000B64FCC9|nr:MULTISPECIES: cell wall hydrolase [unclassified Azospirillum]SNS56571.1 Cell Wall Hydrolase [Azospirillum sp. RU38E]SNS76127.1 Cell Wall Hydrolase [Azospirillum sp. RU37A]